MESLHDLEAAFRRAISRDVVTARQALDHLIATDWSGDLWAAYQASACNNWYSFRASLAGKPGHQKTLRAILALPPRPRPH